MQQLKIALQQMINLPKEEEETFFQKLHSKNYKKNAIVSSADTIPNEIYFIVEGLIRVVITDNAGVEHTIHFALENQFIADYSNFMQGTKSMYMLQALEKTCVVVLPREAIDWGYQNLKEGNKLGRLIAEFYFIYQDNRIKNMYARTPKQRYDSIAEVFPNIHNRVPQHMIASYLGMTPVHLSRLKKASLG